MTQFAIKTPEQIAAEQMLRVMEYLPLDDDSMSHWTGVILEAIKADRAQNALRDGEARFSVEFDPNDWAAMDADRRTAWINEAKHALEDIAYVYRVEVYR